MKRRESLFDRALQVHILNADPSGPKPKEVNMSKVLIMTFVVILMGLFLLQITGVL